MSINSREKVLLLYIKKRVFFFSIIGLNLKYLENKGLNLKFYTNFSLLVWTSLLKEKCLFQQNATNI